MRLPIRSYGKLLARQSGRPVWGRVATTALAAVVGIAAIQGLRAATFATASEAEVGVVAGNAVPLDDSTASGGKSVKFGNSSAPTAPSGLLAFTGGNSIAIRWTGSTVNGSTIKQYDILRDGTKVGSVTPGFHTDTAEKDGNAFIDSNITYGKTYKYQVQAVSTGGGTSALSGSISATAPTSGVPVPNITYTLNDATDLDAITKNVIIPYLKTWYPKVANIMAYPDYMPYTSFNIQYDSSFGGLAWTYLEDGHIRVQPQWVRDHPNDLNMFLHEATHTIQGQATSSGNNELDFIAEGAADYSREYITHDRDPTRPSGYQYYSDGYSPASYFLNYIQEHYDNNYLHKVTVKGHNHTLTGADLQFSNGKSIDEVWAEMMGVTPHTGPAKIGLSSSKCLDGTNSSVDGGTFIQLWDCNGTIAQKITPVNDSDGSIELHLLGSCIDVPFGSTDNGMSLWIVGCNRSNAQKWKINSDGSIVNVGNNKCIDVSGSNTANGTPIQIWDCNGTSAQKWSVPSGIMPALAMPRTVTGSAQKVVCRNPLDPAFTSASSTPYCNLTDMKR